MLSNNTKLGEKTRIVLDVAYKDALLLMASRRSALLSLAKALAHRGALDAAEVAAISEYQGNARMRK